MAERIHLSQLVSNCKRMEKTQTIIRKVKKNEVIYHSRCWWSDRNWSDWRRVSANNRNNFITIHFQTGMKTYNNIIGEHSLWLLRINKMEKKFNLIWIMKIKFQFIHMKLALIKIVPVLFHNLWVEAPSERSVHLCPALDTHYFDRNLHTPNQKMAL